MFQSPGQALDAAIRAFFEPRLGQGLGHVRVHSGPDARALTDRLDARAVTYGSDIGFGAGESPPDRGLLAHDLVHTIQHRGAHAPLDDQQVDHQQCGQHDEGQ